MNWNYRIIEHVYAESSFGLHEVYYDEQGKPNGYILDKTPWGDDIEGVKETLKLMQEAFKAPVLRLTEPDGELHEATS